MIVPAEQPPELDKYEVFEEIGHGGMATVYRARDRRLGRDVAVKVIHRHLRENKEVATRFSSEARAVAKLKHPNIVEVYDVSDEDQAERFLIVELVDGTTLRKLLSDHGHLPPEIAAAVGIEVGNALEHAHGQGVIHRDVKPENVLVSLKTPPTSTRDSQERPSENHAARIKLADFGIAKLLDAQGVTSTGQVLGSPAHMAPEQIEGGDVTARADVFGMGVLLYECMVGRLPFDGKNPAQVLRRVLDGQFTPPERARPTVGGGLSKIVERALCRDAEGRYESAGELCDALREQVARMKMDARRELAEYLADPKAYWKGYEPRVVKRLVELGKEARAERNAPLAAAYFNRALAFRPDDTELLRQVAGLARAERLRRTAIRGGAILAGSLALGAVAFGVARATRTPEVVEPEPVLVKPPHLQPTARAVVPPQPSATSTGTVSEPDTPPKNGKQPAIVFTGAPPPSASAGGKTRLVKILPTGGPAATALINGQPLSLISPPFEVPVGVVTVEAVPPSKDCCEAKKPWTVDVPPGPEPFVIQIPTRFRPAFVVLSGPPESKAECGTIFAGEIRGGATKTVNLTKPEIRGTCTVSGPDGPPKAVPVALRPGVTSPLSWP